MQLVTGEKIKSNKINKQKKNTLISERIEAAERPKSHLGKRLLNPQKSYEMFKILEKFAFLKFPGPHLRSRDNLQCLSARLMSLKNHLDYSKVPKVDEADVDIQFVRGSGPGGQATNKTNNAVVIKHKATGIVVKCHKTRSMWDNKKIAMDNLVTKLDNLINGQESIEAQIKVYQSKKSADKNRKKNKLDKLKAAFKEREGLA